MPLPPSLGAHFDTSPTPMWVHDVETMRVLYVNDAALRRYGWSREALIGRHIADLHPASQQALLERKQAAARAWRSTLGVFEHRHRNGDSLLAYVAAVTLTLDGCLARLVVAHDISDHQRAVRLLAEEAQRYHSLFASHPDAVYSFDREGRFTSANAATARLVGAPVADLLFGPFEPLVEEADRARGRAHFAAALGGAPQHFEMAIVSTADERVPLDVLNVPITVDGETVGVFGIARDLRPQRAAEHAIREQARLLDAVDQAVVAADAAGHVTYWNAAAERIYGWSSADALGRPVLALTVAEPAEDGARAILEASVGGRCWSGECVARRRDGTRFPAQVTASPVIADDGRIVGVVTVSSDISVRRQRLEELRRAHAMLEALVEGSTMAIVGVDVRGDVTVWNAAAERLFGWSAAEIVGRRYPLRPPVGMEVEGSLFRAILAGERVLVDEQLVRLRRDGTPVELSVSNSVLRDERGTVTGIVGFYADITERRHLEAQLRQSQKLEAIGQLAGGVAHDFNNILTVIAANAQFASEELAEEHPAREMVSEIAEAVARGAGLTRQLLAFSRRQVLQPRVIDVGTVARGVERMLRRLIREHVALEVQLAPESMPVWADPGQLEQVLVNLATNAQDAMPEGGTITISAEHVTLGADEARERPGFREGAFVRITVADTGVGMDDDTRLRAFEPFFTTKGLGKGTGLGLSTVFGIVTQSGGIVHLDSRPAA
ncbi:MAG TPA: PAS domain S-box protein, partial [Gemmatimonadaceae bacterium]|nr:PAS domain S-box protein [Gemmatimonadaceae bacterium]